MVSAHVLGNAQDAGLPQAGCGCPNCRAAWARNISRPEIVRQPRAWAISSRRVAGGL